MPTAALLPADPARASRRLHHQDSACSTATHPERPHSVATTCHVATEERAPPLWSRTVSAPQQTAGHIQCFSGVRPLLQLPQGPQERGLVAESAMPHQTSCPLDKPLSDSPAGPSFFLHSLCHTSLCVSEADVDTCLSPRQLLRPLVNHWV